MKIRKLRKEFTPSNKEAPMMIPKNRPTNEFSEELLPTGETVGNRIAGTLRNRVTATGKPVISNRKGHTK